MAEVKNKTGVKNNTVEVNLPPGVTPELLLKLAKVVALAKAKSEADAAAYKRLHTKYEGELRNLRNEERRKRGISPLK